MSRRWCRGGVGLDEGRLVAEFSYEDGEVSDLGFSLSLDGRAVEHKDLIALLGPERAGSAVDEAIQNGIDAPY